MVVPGQGRGRGGPCRSHPRGEPQQRDHPADAPPEEWLAGDCLRGFDPEDDLAPATIIECDWDYDAQVVHWEELEDGPWPGQQEAEEQAMAACDFAQQEVLDQEAVDAYHPLEGVVIHRMRAPGRRTVA